MDKQSPRTRMLIMIASVVAFVLAAVLLFVLPGATRLALVAGQGIHAANAIGLVYVIAGSAFALAGAAGTAYTARQIMSDRRATRQLERRMAYQLPSRDEGNPDVIREHLEHVAEEYPEVADPIGTSLEQLRLLQQHLSNIGQIFGVNPGLLAQGDAQFEYGKFQLLLGRVIEEASRDLNKVVYMAFARKGDSQAPIKPLADAIRQINGKNEERVNAARNLSDKAALTAATFDGDTYITTATQEIQQLIVRLDATNKKKVF